MPGAGHASGFAGCCGVGGGAGQALGAALAPSPGRVVGGGGGCGGTLGTCPAPWALSGQGRGGREAQQGCATLGTLCYPGKPRATLGNPMPPWGLSAIPGPCASLGTLCHPVDPVPKTPRGLRPEEVALPRCWGEGGCGVRGCLQYGRRWQRVSASGFQAGGSVGKRVCLGVRPVGIL